MITSEISSEGIGSLTIAGLDHFGLAAESIDLLKLGSFALDPPAVVTVVPLQPARHVDNVLIGATGDMRARESDRAPLLRLSPSPKAAAHSQRRIKTILEMLDRGKELRPYSSSP